MSAISALRRPRLGFWGIWFFITLAPTSTLIPIPTEVGAERRMYLPLVAVIVVIAMSVRAIIAVLTRHATDPSAARRWIGRLLSAAVVAGLFAATWQRNAEYESGTLIWQTVLDRRPHARAHLNLAAELRDAGRIDEAITHLRAAVPELPEARRALGIELLDRGQTGEAIDQLSAFLRLKPDDPNTLAGREALAAALARSGDVEGAQAQLRLIAAAAPRYALAHIKLAELLMATTDFQGAAAEYRICLSIEPGNVTALAHLGRALASSGDEAAAVSYFRRALDLYPAFDEARRDLISVLLSAERFPEAETEIRAYLSSHADDADGHNSLGIALIRQGKIDLAVQQFAEALQLKPGFQEAKENLTRATLVAGSRQRQPGKSTSAK